jgi:hypothetical protein
MSSGSLKEGEGGGEPGDQSAVRNGPSSLREKLREKGKTFPGFWHFSLVNYRKYSRSKILK